MGTILEAATCGAAAWRCRHTEPTVEAHARACDTRGVIDEQPSRGSAAALDPVAPVLEPAAPALEPAALADPSVPRTQPGTRGQVNEEPAPASSLTQPGTRGQVNEEAAPASSLSLTERLLAWVREFIQFGLVGATAFVIDMGLFNLLQYGPLGVLAGHPNTAQFIAAVIATLYSWVANRLWTYRGRTRDNATREAILFLFANACGIGISQFCLLFTHHILGFTSALADNIAVYVVGFALGTAFRFFFYHYVVFTGNTRA